MYTHTRPTWFEPPLAIFHLMSEQKLEPVQTQDRLRFQNEIVSNLVKMTKWNKNVKMYYCFSSNLSNVWILRSTALTFASPLMMKPSTCCGRHRRESVWWFTETRPSTKKKIFGTLSPWSCARSPDRASDWASSAGGAGFFLKPIFIVNQGYLQCHISSKHQRVNWPAVNNDLFSL